MPTEPESMATPMVSLARLSLSSSLWKAARKERKRRPKLVGSAWTPWVRAMAGVCLWRRARAFKASLHPLKLLQDEA